MFSKNRTMAVLSALSLLLAGCAGPPTDTPETRRDLAMQIADIEIAGGALEETLDQGAELALESTADLLTVQVGRNLSEDERRRIRGVMRAALAEFVTEERWREEVAEVYAEFFTAAELDAVLAFYDSPVGRKIIELQGELTRRLGKVNESILGNRVEEFIATVDEGLTAEFPELAGEEGR